jgi:hypothetical protein
MRGPEPIEVEWIDSVNAGGWHTPSEIETFSRDPGPTLFTLGYVQSRTNKYLFLAQSLHGANRANLVAIPNFAIKRIRKVRIQK